MKKLILLLAAVPLLFASCEKEGEKEQNGGEETSVYVDPYKIFKYKYLARMVLNAADKNVDGKLSRGELGTLTRLDCEGIELSSLSGLENCRNLQVLKLKDCRVPAADLSHFPNLYELDFSGGRLTELNLSANTKLIRVDLGQNQLKTLDVSMLPELNSLDCEDNELETLALGADLSNLSTLLCKNNKIKSLNIASAKNLYIYSLENNGFTELSLPNENSNIMELNCSGCPNLKVLDLKNLSLVKAIYCSDCGLNELRNLDKTAVEYIDCGNCKFEKLDLSGLKHLEEVTCYGNVSDTGDFVLDVSNCAKLKSAFCAKSDLSELKIDGCEVLDNILLYKATKIKTLDVSKCPTVSSIDCRGAVNLETMYVWSGFDSAEIVNAEGLTGLKYVVK